MGNLLSQCILLYRKQWKIYYDCRSLPRPAGVHLAVKSLILKLECNVELLTQVSVNVFRYVEANGKFAIAMYFAI